MAHLTEWSRIGNGPVWDFLMAGASVDGTLICMLEEEVGEVTAFLMKDTAFSCRGELLGAFYLTNTFAPLLFFFFPSELF